MPQLDARVRVSATRFMLACLVLVALLVAGCGTAGDTTITETQTQASNSEGTTTGETTSSGETTSTGPIASASSVPTPPEPTGAGKVGPHYFQSPSQNIGCYLSTKGGVRCDIRERSWSPPPKPKYCIKFGVDWGQGIGVGEHKKASFVCAGDTTLGGPDTLAYGQTAQRGPFICLSAKSGMACENSDTDHGFFLARERYRIY
jgi:uncharacterized protein DUF6636